MSSEESRPKRACEDAMRALLRCVAESECVRAQGGSVKECLREAPQSECRAYHTGYFECRRSQLDMRTRIRGPKFADRG